MALKGDRVIDPYGSRIDLYMDETASRGGVVVYSTAGSGAALDQASNLVTYTTSPSGKVPVGYLLDDMVDVDLTQYKLNQHRSQVQKGGKVSVASKGWVLTNLYIGSPSPGPAYLWQSGHVTPTLVNNIANTPLVGRFEGYPDEDGYVKVSFNL